MLGGGNPVSGSPAGTGKSLHTIGDFAYAYSGLIQVGTGNTLLSFGTGAYLFVGTIQYMVGEDTTDNIVFETKLNGEIITGSLNETAQSANPLNPIPIVLPAYSEVSCDGTNFTGGQTGRKCYAVITGRIYA